MFRNGYLIVLLVLLALALGVVIADAQGPVGGRRAATVLGNGFTYQGQLKQSGALMNGSCDLAFRLYDDMSAGSQIGNPITQTIPITNGLFTTQLDFGANVFNGDARWLDLRVRCPTGVGSFTALSPREPITPAPYALTAMKTAYKNVLVVAKSGGHYNTISAALSSITDNSVTNRYLVYVAPGTFTETVTMKQYVDIEGAGELLTEISQTGSGSPNTGTVVGADSAELRFLTVRNIGGAADAIAIYNSSTSPHLTHISTTASGGSISNYGMYNSSSSATMAHVVASASGGGYTYGVYNTSSSPTMANMSATGSGGSSTNYGVYNTNSSPTMENVIATASGGVNSFGVCNSTSSSPTMTNVSASGVGGSSGGTGVWNSTSSSPTMTNVMATGSGGSGGTGVKNESSSSPTMTNVTASGAGGSIGTGMSNSSSSPTIQNCVISGSGGTNNRGIANNAVSGTYTVTVNNSQISGSGNTIYNDSHFTMLIGGSQLRGGPVFLNGGTVTCAGVWDENYVFSASTCP